MVAASGRAAAAAAARQAEGLTALGSHASSSSLSSITDPSGQVILNPPDYCQQVRLQGWLWGGALLAQMQLTCPASEGIHATAVGRIHVVA